MKPTEPQPAFDFCLILNRSHNTLMRQLDSKLASLHGLSFNDYLILYALGTAPSGKLRRTDLAQAIGVTASGVTRSLLPLEKIHLIERLPDARDARVGYAALTPTGKQLLKHATISIQPIAAEATAALTSKQLEEAVYLLRKLAG
jgi:DNA-binding MarR family transcriptional regulator